MFYSESFLKNGDFIQCFAELAKVKEQYMRFRAVYERAISHIIFYLTDPYPKCKF